MASNSTKVIPLVTMGGGRPPVLEITTRYSVLDNYQFVVSRVLLTDVLHDIFFY